MISVKENRRAIYIQKVKQNVRQLETAEASKESAPKGIRIPVFALKGQCPRPLDDGGSVYTVKKYSRKNDSWLQ